LLRSNAELETIPNGLTLPICTEPTDCLESFQVENRSLFENIVDPIEEGLQEPDNSIVIDLETIKEVEGGIIIEETPAPPQSPEAIPMQIVSRVIKTDNNGTVTESKTNTDIPILLSFFVEDTTNNDFDNGFLEQELSLKTNPNVMVIGEAKFNIFIDKIPVLETPIKLTVEGISDSNGEIDLNFSPTSAIISKSYVFSIKNNAEKFTPTGVSKVETVLLDISIKANEQNFVLTNSTIYSLDIARDPNKILIKNEAGGFSRVFPMDDGLGIGSSVSTVTTSYCFSRTFYTCIQYSSYTSCTQAPAMGGGTITHIKKDGTSEIINTFGASSAGAMNPNNQQSGCGGVTKVSMIIQRDEIYKIDFQNPIGSVKFKTPMEKKDYYFYCNYSYCNYNDKTVIEQLTASLGQ